MATKNKSNDPRRAKIEELRSQQKASERKRTLVLVGIAALVGVILVGSAAFFLVRANQERSQAMDDYGVPAADAGCGEVLDDETSGENDHIADGTRIEYETNPPSSGSHYDTTAGFARKFYTPDDTPPVENLVHNLEHGATIIWYDETVSDEDIDELDLLSDRLGSVDPKVLVAPWDSEDRGPFPEGHIALSHWTIGTGHRQYCERPSGEVINDFVTEFPYTDAPEPNAG